MVIYAVIFLMEYHFKKEKFTLKISKYSGFFKYNVIQ